MYSKNKANILGNLTKEPEIKTMQNGNRVATFGVATSDGYKDKATGEWKNFTEFHNVVIFNKGLVGIAEKYLAKGSKVDIEGKMKTRKWTDKNGNDRYTTEIVLENFGGSLTLLDSRQAQQTQAELGASGQHDPVDDMEDEIPF